MWPFAPDASSRPSFIHMRTHTSTECSQDMLAPFPMYQLCLRVSTIAFRTEAAAARLIAVCASFVAKSLRSALDRHGTTSGFDAGFSSPHAAGAPALWATMCAGARAQLGSTESQRSPCLPSSAHSSLPAGMWPHVHNLLARRAGCVPGDEPRCARCLRDIVGR